jgi:hypothetical protein
MIMGYEMYRRLANGIGLKNKKTKAQAYKCLVDPGPDIIGNVIYRKFEDQDNRPSITLIEIRINEL